MKLGFLGASIDKVDFANKIIVITSKEALISQFIQGAYDQKLKEILKKNTGFDFNIEYTSLDNDLPLITPHIDDEKPAAENLIRQNFLQGDKPLELNIFIKNKLFL